MFFYFINLQLVSLRSHMVIFSLTYKYILFLEVRLQEEMIYDGQANVFVHLMLKKDVRPYSA